MLLACQSTTTTEAESTYADVQIAGAMRNVMWQGELGGIIQLDSLQEPGWYGLGPESFLTGEILLLDGKPFVSKVVNDSSMLVQVNPEASAPFFVYAQVKEWREVPLPAEVKDIPSLEVFVNNQSKEMKRPFAFKVVGQIASGIIHIQNLPPGSTVRSPKEAHQGQVNYPLGEEEVEILGFFSTEHQSVFTHHDTFVHLHLITQDRTKMGHLDEVALIPAQMKLLLPVR